MRESEVVEPLVSIIVPIYNAERYLERCLQSISNQSYKKIEIILVNDASTDKSGSICKQYCLHESRAVLRENNCNMGPSAARNKGLDCARGMYVVFIDGDDFIDLNMIDIIVEAAQKNNADLVSCAYQYYFGIAEKHENIEHIKNEISKEQAFSLLLEPESKFCAVWAKMFSSKLLKTMRFPEDVHFGEDMFFTSLAIQNANRIVRIPEKLYFYSQEGSSLVRSEFNRDKLYMIEEIENWIGIVEQCYPTLLGKARAYYYSTLINMESYVLSTESKKYYQQIKQKVKNILPQCLKNMQLGKRDKMKAVLIVFLSQRSYAYIRKLMRK